LALRVGCLGIGKDCMRACTEGRRHDHRLARLR
jgi:hypothetical protein